MSRYPKRHKGLDEEDLSPPVTITHTALPGWQITRSVKEWQTLGFHLVHELLDGTLELSMYPEWVEVWKVFLTLGAKLHIISDLSYVGQLVLLRYLGEPDFMKQLTKRLKILTQEEYVRALFHLFGKSVPPQDCLCRPWWNWEQMWAHHQAAVEEPAFQHYLQWVEQHFHEMQPVDNFPRSTHTITRPCPNPFVDEDMDALIRKVCVVQDSSWCFVAGGSVAGVMTNTTFQDVDIFVGGIDFRRVRMRFLATAIRVAKTFPTAQLSYCTRGCILQFDIPEKPYAIQVILTYKAGFPTAFIQQFDLPPCQALVWFRQDELKVQARLEALMTWASRHIVWDGTQERTRQRLKKYCQRGYTCEVNLSTIPELSKPYSDYEMLTVADGTDSFELYAQLWSTLTFLPVESDYTSHTWRLFGVIQLCSLTKGDLTFSCDATFRQQLYTHVPERFGWESEDYVMMNTRKETWLTEDGFPFLEWFLPCPARMWVFSAETVFIEPLGQIHFLGGPKETHAHSQTDSSNLEGGGTPSQMAVQCGQVESSGSGRLDVQTVDG